MICCWPTCDAHPQYSFTGNFGSGGDSYVLKDLCIYTLRKTYVKKPYSVDGHFGGPVSEPRQEPLSHCQSIVCQAQESKKENKWISSFETFGIIQCGTIVITNNVLKMHIRWEHSKVELQRKWKWFFFSSWRQSFKSIILNLELQCLWSDIHHHQRFGNPQEKSTHTKVNSYLAPRGGSALSRQGHARCTPEIAPKAIPGPRTPPFLYISYVVSLFDNKRQNLNVSNWNLSTASSGA